MIWDDLNAVVNAIQSVTHGPSGLHEPVFGGNERDYVLECINTGWVSSVGKFVERFEHDLVKFTGAEFAIATVNGTAALHAALLIAGVRQGDEVIAPSLSFVATANAIAYCGAIPHFVDVEERSLGIDAELLERYLESILEPSGEEWRNRRTGRRVAAIVPMHTFGHACRIDSICEIGRRFNLPVVEDAAESLGTWFKGKHTGTFGDLGILSFNGNKILTCGGGGAILTDNPETARLARHLTTTAKVKHMWEFSHDSVGFNYRMPNINAALGCAQLEQVPRFLEVKREIALRYESSFESIAEVDFLLEPENCRSNYWLNAIRLRNGSRSTRDCILEATNKAGLTTRPIWTPLHTLPMYRECPSASLIVTTKLFEQVINLPSGAGIERGWKRD